VGMLALLRVIGCAADVALLVYQAAIVAFPGTDITRAMKASGGTVAGLVAELAAPVPSIYAAELALGALLGSIYHMAQFAAIKTISVIEFRSVTDPATVVTLFVLTAEAAAVLALGAVISMVIAGSANALRIAAGAGLMLRVIPLTLGSAAEAGLVHRILSLALGAADHADTMLQFFRAVAGLVAELAAPVPTRYAAELALDALLGARLRMAQCAAIITIAVIRFRSVTGVVTVLTCFVLTAGAAAEGTFLLPLRMGMPIVQEHRSPMIVVMVMVMIAARVVVMDHRQVHQHHHQRQRPCQPLHPFHRFALHEILLSKGFRKFIKIGHFISGNIILYHLDMCNIFSFRVKMILGRSFSHIKAQP